MHRRAYLAGSIGFVGSLAGCTDVLDGSDDSEDDRGPAATIQVFYEALLNGDAETARSYFHPDAGTRPSDEYVADVQQSSLQLERTRVVVEDEEEATVKARLSREMENGERVLHRDFLLQRGDGEWKIHRVPSARWGPAIPQAQWDVTERTEGGAVTAVVFEHGGGDTVDSATLRATVPGATVDAPGTASDVTTGTTVVIPLDGDGASVGSGSTVDLVWADPESDGWLNLTSHTITSDTAGSPVERIRIE